jgi:DNA-binding CsgD family transcriptional regulator
MNLSTKEIASILNITTRGVEVSRYRLRKKMDLENGANIGEFLSQL